MSVPSGIISGVSVWTQVVGQPEAVEDLRSAVDHAARVHFSTDAGADEGGVDEVHLVSTDFVSMLTQRPSVRRLLPLAYEGLDKWEVAPAIRDRLLGIIEQRCLTGRNGASWQAATFHRLYDETSLDRHDVLRRMTREYIEHMHSNQPVHSWPTR